MRAKPVEVKLDPVDNQRLARLCGSLDENLRQIESALDVTIARRGARFTVRGTQAERAAQAIEHFYDRASGDLTVDDVQLGLVEFSKNPKPGKTEGPQLLTRRQDLHGSTPHQIEYIENILREGSPVVGVSCQEGLLMVTFRRQQRKIFEIYDTLLFAGIGTNAK